MTPQEFIDKWRGDERKERAASQQHFLELCDVLDVPKPGDPGISPKDYDFAVSLKKPGMEAGEADVFKRGCFAWEYKGPKKSLVEAYRQLKDYADALDNPPLLIVSDMREIQVHTNFTNTVKRVHRIAPADLNSVETRKLLRATFLDPEKLRPDLTRERATAEAAATIGDHASELRRAGHDPRRIAHFLNKLVFCMFAEDIGLLPDNIFGETVEESVRDNRLFAGAIEDLFKAMRLKGGRFGAKRIPWFNGGLFGDDDVIALTHVQLATLRDASLLDWSQIEPSIFGTLFESGLDPAKRKEMASLFDVKPNGKPHQANLFDSGADKGVGIHYTDPEKIRKIVEPVVLRPLRAEWEAVKSEVAKQREVKSRAKSDTARTRAEHSARDSYFKFRERLGRYRVLDPACGSGNFLYLALLHLKDFDRKVQAEAAGIGLPLDNDRVTPDAVMGIEINPYAAELAQLTIWIGEIQWQMTNAGGIRREPILGKLAQIECRDAVLNPDSSEAKWPVADAIIGNPPFLGCKLMYRALGVAYTKQLRAAYEGRVSPFADLVCFWFEKARAAILQKASRRAGFVATNSIRGGKNRLVLDAITRDCRVYEAWSDEPWVIDGASVRVSLICFSSPESQPHGAILDGAHVHQIHSDLTPQGTVGKGADITKAKRLSQNRAVAFVGTVKAGAFDISGHDARLLLTAPVNPNGRPNRDVVVPWMNGLDIVRRPQDKWIIDFGLDRTAAEATLYEGPFRIVEKVVKPARLLVRRPRYRNLWWLQAEPCAGMRSAVSKLARFIATPVLAKYRLFCWLSSSIQPDHQLIAIARDDDVAFGILHSRYHELWALRLGTSLEDRPRYTPSTTFETYPFPEGTSPQNRDNSYASDPRSIRIGAAAKRLNELRENWLNPPDLVRRVPEVVPGYPERVLPVSEKAAKELKKRTLTNLYNDRPQWLADAHRALDEAVAAAYGWPADLSDDEVLARLLALNLSRAKAENASANDARPKTKQKVSSQ